MIAALRPAALVVAACLALPAVAQDHAALRATLDRHLEAINARDLETLLATVTSGSDLVTILADGRVLETRDEYRQLHIDWFADRSWQIDFQVEDVRIAGGAGIARVRYRSLTEGGADANGRDGRETLLVLVFAPEQGAWRLVHDQNTAVPPAAH